MANAVEVTVAHVSRRTHGPLRKDTGDAWEVGEGVEEWAEAAGKGQDPI